MQLIDVNQALSTISDCSRAGDHSRVRDLARALCHELAEVDTRDPLELGWARFYEIKSAHALGDWQGAWEALNRSDGVGFALPEPNGSYLCSLASEVAQKLGRLDGVLLWGERCLAIRRSSGASLAEAQCAGTVCALLSRLGKDGENTRFATRLLELGRERHDGRELLDAYRSLFDNQKQSGDGQVRALLVAGLDELRGQHDDATSARAIELIQAIQSAPWFDDALAPSARAERARTSQMRRACTEGDVASVRRLLDTGFDVDARDAFDRTPLIHAAFAGKLEVVALLLERGADLHAENLQRRTALVLAADQGFAPIVERLLAAGADPDHAGIADQTALIVASWQGHAATVSALLRGGASAELRDVAGNTALTLTATEDQPEVIHRLLDGGARIDATTADGHTALMKAAMEGRERVARVLLERGANPTLLDRHGMTAESWARQEKFPSLAQELGAAARRWRG